jgi:DNA-binding transcriptional LysR family regulator
VIEVRHLRYFLAVSEELHFRRAAERLMMAQPPLSQAIRKLEEELGLQLFERTTRVVTLTEAGIDFAGRARQVVESFDLAIAETRQSADVGRPVRIGFTPHLPIELLLRFLHTLREHAPTVRTEVTHLLTTQQLERLRSCELDFGIVTWPSREDDLEAEPLFPGELLAAYLPSNHPLAEQEVITPAHLAAEALVSFPRQINPALTDWLQLQADRAGYRFASLHHSAGRDARDWILSVGAGAGVALLPQRFKEVTDAGTLVTRRPLEPPLRMPDTVVAWRDDRPPSLQPLISTILRVAQELRATEIA